MVHEFIVIGSGSTGSSIAHSLSSISRDVILIDKQGIANGTTGKSSALVRTHYSNPVVARMAMYSRDILANFTPIGYSGYTKTGMIYGFPNSDIPQEEKNLSMLRGIGANFDVISFEKLSGVFPSITETGNDLIIHEPDSGYADPVATSNSFVAKAREQGCKTMISNEVIKIGVDSDGPYITLKDGKVIHGKKVVIATNIWTNDLLLRSGVDPKNRLPIMPTLHNVIYLRRPLAMQGIKPTYWDMNNLAYYKMEGETVTALGSLDPDLDRHECDVDDNNYDGAMDKFVEKYLNKISSRIPAMDTASMISSISGKYDMTPDGHPIIDTIESLGFPNFYSCVGMSGHGFKLSPAFGLIVKEMMEGIEKEKRIFDWDIFSLKRFSQGTQMGRTHENIGTLY